MKVWGMRRKTWFIIIVLVGLLGIGVYAFCIPCQFFGYKRLPSVEQVLANPSVKPVTMGEVYVLPSISELCMTITLNPLIKRELSQTIYDDTAKQFPVLDKTYKETVSFYIDNLRWSVSFASLMLHYRAEDVCAEFDRLAAGYHVAHVSFEAPLGQVHQYTWVFEVTGDDVVPDVTATAVR